MFSASYQRYSGARRGEACSRNAETRGRGDAGTEDDSETRRRGDAGNPEVVRRAHTTIKRTTQRKLMNAFLWSIGQAAQSYARAAQVLHHTYDPVRSRLPASPCQSSMTQLPRLDGIDWMNQ